MAVSPYTTVTVQSAKPLPGAGLQIILVARGAGRPDVVDTYSSNGLPFQPLTLRDAAIALVSRLNANDDLQAHIEALVGQPIDVTPLPLPPPDPTTVAIATFVPLWIRYRAIVASADATFGDENLVGAARHAAKQFYDSITDPAVKERLDLVIKGPV